MVCIILSPRFFSKSAFVHHFLSSLHTAWQFCYFSLIFCNFTSLLSGWFYYLPSSLFQMGVLFWFWRAGVLAGNCYKIQEVWKLCRWQMQSCVLSFTMGFRLFLTGRKTANTDFLCPLLTDWSKTEVVTGRTEVLQFWSTLVAGI